MTDTIILTEGQQAAYDKVMSFILDPDAQVMVISGYAGTGKSTLVKTILENIPSVLKTANLLSQDEIKYDIALTATTNKAAEALESILGKKVATIQSFLGLTVRTDYTTGKTELKPAKRKEDDIHTDSIVFIDEASYIDSSLLNWVFTRTRDCKIIFIGDPAQLTPIKSTKTPVFSVGFPTVALTEVVRQAEGNPIIKIATVFRHTVNTGEWNSIELDNKHLVHLPREQFNQAILNEFSRENWKHEDSKVLAWTNKTVTSYNKEIRNVIHSVPHLEKGDYAICNKYICNKECNIKTDELVYIDDIEPGEDCGIPGWNVTMNGEQDFAFLPASLEDKKRYVNQMKKEKNYGRLQYIDTHWIDLRAAYACTINKSQGSTYDRVFIDLDDLKNCRNGQQIARMMYVAVSRARDTVVMTGDLV